MKPPNSLNSPAGCVFKGRGHVMLCSSWRMFPHSSDSWGYRYINRNYFWLFYFLLFKQSNKRSNVPLFCSVISPSVRFKPHFLCDAPDFFGRSHAFNGSSCLYVFPASLHTAQCDMDLSGTRLSEGGRAWVAGFCARRFETCFWSGKERRKWWCALIVVNCGELLAPNAGGSLQCLLTLL